MDKSEILEYLVRLINEEVEHALHEDEALKMSDERRAKFKKTVFSNPPAYNSAGTLKEADALSPVPPEEPDAPSPATPAGESVPAADGGGMEAMPSGTEPPTDLGGDPAAGGGAMPPDGAEDPAMDDMGADLGGGGGMGMGGFGGGGGGGLDLGGEGEEGGEEAGGEPPPPPSSFDPFKDSKTLEDRLQVILDTATQIADQTQDPQKVLKAVKGMIQNGFQNPATAARAISDLFGTDNPVLQQVSRRLALFTWGV